MWLKKKKKIKTDCKKEKKKGNKISVDEEAVSVILKNHLHVGKVLRLVSSNISVIFLALLPSNNESNLLQHILWRFISLCILFK